MQSQTVDPAVEPKDDLRTQAMRRLERKRDFRAHLLAFVLVNGFLWVIWALVLAGTGNAFPWPLIPMFGWGIGLVFHAWEAYGRLPFSEEDLQREQARLQNRS